MHYTKKGEKLTIINIFKITATVIDMDCNHTHVVIVQVFKKITISSIMYKYFLSSI